MDIWEPWKWTIGRRCINIESRRYLQIYESFYDKGKKTTAHKSYKALGYEDKLIESGIDDPISYYKAEVDRFFR